MTTALGSLSFFLVRFISKHDEFVKETQSAFEGLTHKINKQAAQINITSKKIDKAMQSPGLDKRDKKRVDDLRQQVFTLKKTLKTEVLPMAKDMGEYNERVEALRKQIHSQEKKIKVMYDSVRIMLDRRNSPK